MKTKHTPGQWVFNEKHKGIFVNNKLIITCWSVRNTDDTRLPNESWLDMRKRIAPQRIINDELEPIANAKLIAAAPELLEQLQSILDGSAFDKETGLIWSHRLVEIEKVINKATK